MAVGVCLEAMSCTMATSSNGKQRRTDERVRMRDDERAERLGEGKRARERALG